MKLTSYKIDRSARVWYHFDAEDKVLGRMSTEVATLLMGKHKPNYTPLFDSGDYVVITNAKKIRLTGVKAEQKKYYTHSGYIGNLKTKTFKQIMAKKPTYAIYESVRRMLPKTLLGRKMLKKLRVYPGADHPHKGINFVNNK